VKPEIASETQKTRQENSRSASASGSVDTTSSMRVCGSRGEGPSTRR
jgi:hypothetical protein